MDIRGLISNTIRTASDRVLTWLADSGVEVRVEYHVGDVHYNRVLVGREGLDRNRPPPHPGQEEPPSHSRTLLRLGAAIGSAVIVGTAVAAAGAVLAAPNLMASFSNRDETASANAICSDALIFSKCVETDSIGDCTADNGCAVCMDVMKGGERVLVLPCLHRYHTACILPWLRSTGRCSICRHSLVDDS